MRLTPGVTIENTNTVTRQTLFDLLANALGGLVVRSDFESTINVITVDSTVTSSPNPGQILYDQTDLLWKCYFDMVDNTGVSLWLSFGPDRFDEALIASEPIPYGAAVRLDSTRGGRWARLTNGYQDPAVIGLNQNGTGIVGSTTASGSWFPCGIEGFMTGWFPTKGSSTETGLAGASSPGNTLFPINWALGGLGNSASGNNNNSFICAVSLHIVAPIASEPNIRAKVLFCGSRYTKSP